MRQGDGVGSVGKRQKVDSDRLLLVEGEDEVGLFSSLIGRCLKGAADIQVIAAGGKDQFPRRLQAIRIGARTRPTLRSIGVVRDADDNPSGAFQSVCDHLRNAGYEPPESHGTFSDASPAVGVFVLPDGNTPGAVESLCRESVKNTDVARCVEQYLNCLTERDAMQSNNRDKSFAHAYLASMRNPVARVGEGARMGFWDLNSPVFNDLSGFVRELSE